jgi:hypothetical protein
MPQKKGLREQRLSSSSQKNKPRAEEVAEQRPSKKNVGARGPRLLHQSDGLNPKNVSLLAIPTSFTVPQVLDEMNQLFLLLQGAAPNYDDIQRRINLIKNK